MGFLSRINRLHIIAAGGVIFVALLVAFSLSFLQPTLRQIKDAQAEQEKQEATWKQLPQKVAALGQAQQALGRTQAEAQAFLATMPKISSEPLQGMFDLHREYSTGMGPAVYRFFASRGFAPRGIQVPAAPMQLYSPTPVLTVPMTGFGVVAKSFPAALNLLRELKDMPRLGVIGGITLRGTSPNLDVTMPLTFYIVTEQALNPSAGAAALAAALAAKGAGGGAAGPAGGRPPRGGGLGGGLKIRMGGRPSRGS